MRSRLAPEQGRFTGSDVDRPLDEAWARYDEGTPRLPPQPTIGSAMNVRLACFTLAFFESLLRAGAERPYAIELVSDAAWRIYQRWARIAVGLARLWPGGRTALGFARIDREGRVSLRFPFNAPGYVVETVLAERRMAFDVVKCPVAQYFRARGATDLCLAPWCNLDYALADLTREKLTRTKTLVRRTGSLRFSISSAG
jgi:L-2-amino-thiazoline-4-carboxylic acid hydrolase